MKGRNLQKKGKKQNEAMMEIGEKEDGIEEGRNCDFFFPSSICFSQLGDREAWMRRGNTREGGRWRRGKKGGSKHGGKGRNEPSFHSLSFAV